MERLNKHDALAGTPVIVLTGRELADNQDRALQAGAVAFFQKPVDDSKLLLAINKALYFPEGKLRSED
jgi:CheY-like chemotaxis protein